MTVLHRLSLLGAALALVGCASVSPDGLRGDVAQLTAGRTAGVQAALPAADAAAKAQAQESIQRWLAEPLTQDAATAREDLNRRLGVWGTQAQYQLAGQLPPLPAAALPADGIETTALRERLDVQAARRQLDTQAVRVGWSRAGAVFGDIGLAYQSNTATERGSGHRDTTRGWELELPLPLFDWGGAARTRAQAEVEQAAAQLQDTAVRARTEVRSAWLTYRTALDLARQQQSQVVPLRQFISEETTLRYNGMLASVWDMLAEARNSTQAVANAIEAQRDFWLAETDLQLALTGTSSGALQGLASGAATAPSPQGH